MHEATTASRTTVAIDRARAQGLVGTDTIRSDPEHVLAARREIPSLFDVELGRLPVIPLDKDGQESSDLVEVSVLGGGGMGVVLLARQRSLSRDVAVKTLHPTGAEGDAEALVREGRITGALEHPGIVPVHALGVSADGSPLLVMKRIDGIDWETLLRDPQHDGWSSRLGAKGDRLDANLEILTRVCQTLEFAHSRGVIHRDIKPANVMIGAFGEVYLVDWGLAMPIGWRDPSVVGTPAYIAPEMVTGDPIDERTDVYILGAVLHRVLVGRPRNGGATVAEMLAAALQPAAQAYPASVPSLLADICNAATSADPHARPAGVRELRERLVAVSRYRSVLTLCDAASASVSALERLIDEAGDRPIDLVKAYRLGTEARFGFAQCIATYAEHGPAREGARRCLGALVRLELAQSNVQSAAALLAEIDRPDEALVRSVDAARAAAERAELEHSRLLAVERDRDPSVGKRGRHLAQAMFFAVIAGISATVYADRVALVPGDPRLIAYVGVSLALSLVAAIPFRKMLRESAYNRKFVALFVFIQLAMLANRTVAWTQATPIKATLSTDLLLIAVAAGASAFLFERRMVAVLAAAVAAVLVLQLSTPVELTYNAGVLLALAASFWAVRAQQPSDVVMVPDKPSGS